MKLKWVVFFMGVVCFELLFLRLGYWQYNRMHEKEALKAEFIENIPARTKVLHGTFDHSREVVLESQRYKNEYGYRVLTPFIMDEKEIIVDRGWIPRSFEPDFLLPFHAVGTHTVEGVIRDVPQQHQTWFKGSDFGAAGDVKILQLLKLENIPTKEGVARMDGVYLQATKVTVPKMKAFMVLPDGGEKHEEYMYTWWSLAFLLPLLSFFLWFKSKREDEAMHA